MKRLLTAAAVLWASAAYAELPMIAPIHSVVDAKAPSKEIRICTGAAGGAYNTLGNQMLGLIQSSTGLPTSVKPGGGTVGCLRKMAEGTMEMAIVQLDSMAWLADTSPDLSNRLSTASIVLSEQFIAICRRDDSIEDLNSIARSNGEVISIAGGAESGSLLTMNVLASFNSGFKNPNYRLAGDWETAIADVRSHVSRCAFGIMSIDGPLWADINDKYGKEVRLVGFWNRAMRQLKISGQQVYGWVAIPADTDNLDRMLDWNGKGKRWSPEVGVVPAIVVYRNDMLPGLSGPINESATRVAHVLPFKY